MYNKLGIIMHVKIYISSFSYRPAFIHVDITRNNFDVVNTGHIAFRERNSIECVYICKYVGVYGCMELRGSSYFHSSRGQVKGKKSVNA